MSACLCVDAPETTRLLLLISGICKVESHMSHQLQETTNNWTAPSAPVKAMGE